MRLNGHILQQRYRFFALLKRLGKACLNVSTYLPWSENFRLLKSEVNEIYLLCYKPRKQFAWSIDSVAAQCCSKHHCVWIDIYVFCFYKTTKLKTKETSHYSQTNIPTFQNFFVVIWFTVVPSTSCGCCCNNCIVKLESHRTWIKVFKWVWRARWSLLED